MKNKWTLDAWLNEAKRLRAQHEAAEVEFYDFLVETESEMESEWTAAGFTTFADFLDSSGLCDARRYNDYKRGRSVTADDVASKIGVECVLQISRASDEKAGSVRDALLTEVENKGSPISAERARQIRHAIEPKIRVPMSGLWKERAERAERENAALRGEVKRLSARVAELESSIDRAAKAETRESAPKQKAVAQQPTPPSKPGASGWWCNAHGSVGAKKDATGKFRCVKCAEIVVPAGIESNSGHSTARPSPPDLAHAVRAERGRS